MKQPDNTKIFESELATFWFDEKGILFAVAKKTTSRTLEMQKDNFALIKQITGNKKVCLLSDTTNASKPNTETRKYMEKEFPYMFKANAIISKSVMGELYPKVSIILSNHTLTIKHFDEEKEAKEWLIQYL